MPPNRFPRTVGLAIGLAIVFLAGATSAAASVPCTKELPAGSHPIQIPVGAVERSALGHVPASLPAGTRVPLLLALHGAYGNGTQMESYSGFSKIADRDGFIVVYPSSAGIFWNSTGASSQADDVAFLRALIAYVERNACVDSQQVFATGVSNGGGMVALAGCELSDQIAAIAPVAGDYSRQPPCTPIKPVSLLEIHGTADRVAGYFGSSGRATKSGLPQFVTAWRVRDGCPGALSARVVAAGTRLFRWDGCTSAVSVEHIQIKGGAHQWPGATPPDPGPPATICASCTIWSFFAGLGNPVREWSTSGGVGLN